MLVSLLSAPLAHADKDSWWCAIPMVCEAKEVVDFVSDPTGYILQQLVDANIWFLGKLLGLLQQTSSADVTSPGFLKQYALIFGAASIFTVVLWIIAVAKRAVRGVPLGTALSEALGFLVLQLVVNALTPGAVALVLQVVDDISSVFEPRATKNFKPFLSSLIRLLSADVQGSVMVLIVINLVMMCAALMMWVELLLRSAAIYVAVALGPLVNAGLVDRDLWGKTKRWVAVLLALALVKPVLFALLGLGGAVLSGGKGMGTDRISKILVGALILFLAVFASAVIYKWIPIFGDEMASLGQARKTASSSGPMSMSEGPASHANMALSRRVQSSIVGRSGGGGARTASPSPGSGGGAGPGPTGGASSGAGGAGGAGGAAGGAVGGVAAAGAAAVKSGAGAVRQRADSLPAPDPGDGRTDGGGAQSPPSSQPPAPPPTGSGGVPVVRDATSAQDDSGTAPPPPPPLPQRPPNHPMPNPNPPPPPPPSPSSPVLDPPFPDSGIEE
ncbi:hypothetical protein [Streptomyces sp. NPDC048172]|uniref:hypothetical protein n=1 Tax=Streptomyces sp. NPDC048172 TaxID=3365505 RepID=UPI00371C0802